MHPNNELQIMRKDINNAFSMIADYEGDVAKLFEESIDGDVPVLGRLKYGASICPFGNFIALQPEPI